MRLQEVYYICKKAYDSWPELSFEEKKATGNITYYKLTNADQVKALLSDLVSIPSFSDNIAAIKEVSIGFDQIQHNIYLDSREKGTLVKEYTLLEGRVSTIVELFQSIGYMQNSDGFDIKLPPNISLSDLSKCTRDLNTIFSTCPLLANMDATITFSAVDVGSVWLSFVVSGTAVAGALAVIASLVDKAIIIRSHHLTTKEQAEKIRSLELGNDILKNAEEISREMGKKLLDTVCSDLSKEHAVKEPEDFERLKNSVQLLSDWMGKGMEIYASIQSAPETKAVFSPIDKQSLPESTLEMLTKGNNEVEE